MEINKDSLIKRMSSHQCHPSEEQGTRGSLLQFLKPKCSAGNPKLLPPLLSHEKQKQVEKMESIKTETWNGKEEHK